MAKVAGSDNQSDMLTKHVDRQTLEKHLASLDLIFEEGKAESAPVIEAA